MNNESRLFLELWNAVRDNIPKNTVDGVLASWFTSFEDFGIEYDELIDLLGEEKVIVESFNDFFADELEESEPEEEEDEY